MIGPDLGSIWDQPRNSYTVSVNADVPLWDWGAEARIEAATIGLSQELAMEGTRAVIRSDITSAVESLNAYRERTADMAENLEVATQLAESSLSRYAQGDATALELRRSPDRQSETAANLLDTYLGYRRALLDLQELTYYDFEHDAALLERFRAADRPLQ